MTAVVALASLAASPALASQDPNPPWPQLLPPAPLTDATQPGPVAHCKRATMRCFDGNIARMKALVARLGCDHRAVFATFYFRSVSMYEHGKPVPGAWKTAFDSARTGDDNAGQDMLLGINAHVQRDMPCVLATVGLRTRKGVSRKPDHDVVNGILDAAYEPIVTAIGKRYDPIVKISNASWDPIDDIGGLEMVKGWREGVWRNAERLLAAKTAAARQRVIASIETNATTWAQLIAAGQVPGYRAQRDAYCAAGGTK